MRWMGFMQNRRVIAVLVGALVVAGAIVAFQSQTYQAVTDNQNSSSQAKVQPFRAPDPDTLGQVLVHTGPGEGAFVAGLVSDEGLVEQTAQETELAKIGYKLFKVSDSSTATEVVARANQKAKGNNKKTTVEADVLLKPTLIPNDPGYSQQWHLPKINAPVAWNTTSATGTTIAIVDTGVNCSTTPELNCVPGYNFINNSIDTTDVTGHGTAVAEVAAEIGNNATSAASVAFSASIMPFVACTTTGCSGSAIASGITYAADHGVKVVNASISSMNIITVVGTAANYLRNKGGVFVAAAGNSGTEDTSINNPNVVIVSATDSTDAIATWSTFGAPVDVSAPGQSSFITGDGTHSSTVGSGTSFASPIAAGVVDLILSGNPSLFTNDINGATLAESILESTTHDLGIAGWDKYYGWGRVDAGAAVAKALGSTGGTADTTAPSAPTNLTATAVSDTSVGLSWNASTDNVGVTGYQVLRNGTKIATTGGTSYADTGLTASTSYSYTVTASDLAGNVSAVSNTATATTQAANTAVQILSFSVSKKTATSATITWTTNVVSTGSVAYGKTSTLGSTAADPVAAATTHTLTITGLTASSKYFYQITATGADGSTAKSLSSTFRTLKK
jgi:thermitase